MKPLCRLTTEITTVLYIYSSVVFVACVRCMNGKEDERFFFFGGDPEYLTQRCEKTSSVIELCFLKTSEKDAEMISNAGSGVF